MKSVAKTRFLMLRDKFHVVSKIVSLEGAVRDVKIQEMDNTNAVRNGEERLHASVS
jgi:hypothetical protein